MKFKFKAVKTGGEEQSGEREAVDRFALAREMHSQGLVLVSAEPLSDNHSHAKWREWLGGGLPLRDLVMLSGSISSMLSAGLSLGRSLEVMKRQTTRKRFKAVLNSLLESTNRGESFSQALAAFPRVFPPVLVAMVAAGEESGNLPQALEVVRAQLAKTYELRRKIVGAMIYPILIVGVIVVIAILMMIFLVPNLTSLFTELKVELPLSTRIVIGISNFLTHHYLIFIAALLLVGLSALRFFQTARGQAWWSGALLHLPAVGTIVRQLNAAVTMRTLSSLISAGVNLIEALNITAQVLQNPRYRQVIAGAGKHIGQGGSLSSLFHEHENIFPILVAELAEVGEETGNLSGMLLKGAQFFEEEVDQATKNLSSIVEPALMVLIGLFVGFFAISMLGPMYSLSDAIK